MIKRIVWTPPATRVDGSPLPLADIQGFLVFVRPSSDPIDNATLIATKGQADTEHEYNFGVGSWLANVVAVTAEGNSDPSADSPELTVPPEPALPSPPTGVDIIDPPAA